MWPLDAHLVAALGCRAVEAALRPACGPQSAAPSCISRWGSRGPGVGSPGAAGARLHCSAGRAAGGAVPVDRGVPAPSSAHWGPSRSGGLCAAPAAVCSRLPAQRPAASNPPVALGLCGHRPGSQQLQGSGFSRPETTGRSNTGPPGPASRAGKVHCRVRTVWAAPARPCPPPQGSVWYRPVP